MNSTISYLIGILFILLGVAVSIAWHELGHLLPAKKFGVKVSRYMIGFGPTLFSRKRGETEYGIKAIPLGGYISMAGMFPPEKAGAKSNWLTKLANEARKQQLEADGQVAVNRRFYSLSVPKRMLIMLGGPLMNLILGCALMLLALTVIGTQQLSTKIEAVSDCLPQIVNSQVAQKCDPATAVAPAKAAGLLAGDRIVKISDTEVSSWNQVTPILDKYAGQAVPIDVERSGKTVTFLVVPVTWDVPLLDESTGELQLDAAGKVRTTQRTMIGIKLGVERAPVSIAQAVSYSGAVLGQTFDLVLELPVKLAEISTTALNGQARAADSPVSLVGIGQIAGELASDGRIDWLDKLATGLLMLGSLNFALFVFNLIPLLPLDGGHVLSAIYEAIKKVAFKVFRKKDPGPVDTAKMVPLTMVMWVVLLGMSVLIIAADLVNPIHIQ